MKTTKLTSALRKIEQARRALEKEQKRIAKSGTKKDKRLISGLLDKLDATQVQLLSVREQARTIQKRHIKETKPRKVPRTKGKKAKRERQERLPETLRTRQPELLATRELSIRGFWDRYPKEEQKRYPKRFKQFPSALRRGPTAFDLLLRDYLSFTPAQRKRLQLRVAYGVNHETGKILTERDVDKMGLHIDLSTNKEEAIAALRTVLTRAGLVYAPIGWEDDTEDASVPLGVEWWIV